jgi:hypothetical protein
MLSGNGIKCGIFLMLILEFPNEKHRAAYEDMVHGWRNVETPTSPGKLFTGKNFDEFLATVQCVPVLSQARMPYKSHISRNESNSFFTDCWMQSKPK